MLQYYRITFFFSHDTYVQKINMKKYRSLRENNASLSNKDFKCKHSSNINLVIN